MPRYGRNIAQNFTARETRPGHYVVRTTITLTRDLVEWLDDLIGSGECPNLAYIIVQALKHYRKHYREMRGEK